MGRLSYDGKSRDVLGGEKNLMGCLEEEIYIVWAVFFSVLLRTVFFMSSKEQIIVYPRNYHRPVLFTLMSYVLVFSKLFGCILYLYILPIMLERKLISDRVHVNKLYNFNWSSALSYLILVLHKWVIIIEFCYRTFCVLYTPF